MEKNMNRIKKRKKKRGGGGWGQEVIKDYFEVCVKKKENAEITKSPKFFSF